MSILITLVTFAIILIILVIAHELGHFITAKLRGVQVTEFGLGFPPRIWGIKKGETLYSINAVPLGGFVKLVGEEDPKIPRSLASKGYGTRILVLAAGSLVNLLLPVVLFTIAFMIPHSAFVFPVVIDNVAPDSPAAVAGVQPGDTIIKVDGNQINNSADLQRQIHLNLGKEIDLTLMHADSSEETVQVTARWKPPEGQGATGLVLAMPSEPIETVIQSEPFWKAVPMGITECWETLILFKNEIVRWIIGATSPQITGPVGIAELTGEVAKTGISPLFALAAFISINLAIINILPLPALDGGRIAFVLLEMLRRGRRVSPRTEGIIHMIGFMLLIALILVVTYSDIINIATTGSALP